MNKYKFLGIASVSILVACVFVGNSATAHAEGTSVSTPPPVQSSSTSNDYSYTAKAGDNLTLLTRRSVQLYDTAREDVTLTPASIVYIENGVVNETPPREIALGEKVIVSGALLKKYADNSKALTKDQLLNWQYYADVADFNLGYIVPNGGTVATADEQNSSTTTPAPTTTSQTNDLSAEAKRQAELDAAAKKSDEKNNSNNKNAPWYWWLIGGATLAVLYFILGGRTPDTEE